jgi:hypothetical protein
MWIHWMWVPYALFAYEESCALFGKAPAHGIRRNQEVLDSKVNSTHYREAAYRHHSSEPVTLLGLESHDNNR